MAQEGLRTYFTFLQNLWTVFANLQKGVQRRGSCIEGSTTEHQLPPYSHQQYQWYSDPVARAHPSSRSTTDEIERIPNARRKKD